MINRRSYIRAKGSGSGAGAFRTHPIVLSLSEVQGVLDGVPRGPTGPLEPPELAAVVLTWEPSFIVSR